MKFINSNPEIYENVFDGLSYYPTVGEIYHSSREKSKVIRFYLEAVRNREKPKVLDIGCFIGTDLFMLPKIKEGAKFWGVDISQSAISHACLLAKKRKEESLEFLVMDVNKEMIFEDNLFDIVIALELIEHLENPKRFLQEVKRVLKKGGILILSTPNEDYLLNKISKYLPPFFLKRLEKSREADFSRHGSAYQITPEVWDKHAHISVFGYPKWVEIFKQSGLEIEAVEGSCIFGGSRFISERPFLLGLAIIFDFLIDKIPLKPYFQMSMILKLKNV